MKGLFSIFKKSESPDKQEKEENKEGFTLPLALEFRNACIDAGINDINSDLFRKKVKLIAENNPKFAFSVQDDLYLNMFEAAEAEAKRQEKEREIKLEGEQRRVAELTEKDKRVDALTGILDSLQLVDDYRMAVLNNNVAMQNSLREKERNVGMASIIGSAIGGLSVGIALTADAIDKNAGIRQRNAARNTMFDKELMYDHLDFVTRKSKLKKLIEDAKIKVSNTDISKEELFEAIEFGNGDDLRSGTFDNKRAVKAAYSWGNSLNILTCARLKRRLEVAGGIEGVLDGVIKALIYDGEVMIGEAYLQLPIMGMNYDWAPHDWRYDIFGSYFKEKNVPHGKSESEIFELSGICASAQIEQGKNYRVELEPYKLWIMER